MPEYAIRFDKTRCIACMGCITSCQAWRSLPDGLTRRRVLRSWEGAYPTVRLSHLSLGCQHCLTPDCLAACPSEAITKDPATGAVLTNSESCIGCRSCEDACRYEVPRFNEDGTMNKCDLCTGLVTGVNDQPPCVATCPTQALKYGPISIEEKRHEEETILALTKQARTAPA